MELIFAGTGSAFCLENYQSNVVIKNNDRRLLIDCGSDIRFALRDLGLSVLDINAVYVSHLHADHIGGLECLGFCNYFNHEKPNLYCEGAIMDQLWNNSLKGGMIGLEGINANLDTYFELHPVKRNTTFIWQNIEFELVQSMHISAKYMILDSFGLLITPPNSKNKIYFTTDTQFAPINSIMKCYDESHTIFHDCETMYKSGVHAHYDNLNTLDKEIKKKMCLYHYQDNVVLEWDKFNKQAREDGFQGFIKKGESFKF